MLGAPCYNCGITGEGPYIGPVPNCLTTWTTTRGHFVESITNEQLTFFANNNNKPQAGSP